MFDIIEPLIFKTQPFHYLDNKLLSEKCHEKVIFSWTEYLTEQKKELKNQNFFFLVTNHNKILMMDTYLLNFLKLSHNKNCLEIDINNINNLNVYWIQIHDSQESYTYIKSNKNTHFNLIHDNIVCEKGHARLNIDNLDTMNYYHTVNSKVSQLFHQEALFHSYGNLEQHFFQRRDHVKIKLDKKIILHEKTEYNSYHLINIQDMQLRDDTIEVLHESSDTKSVIHYLSLNGGKSVSQINSIIPSDTKRCETHQHIKHILTSENAQSFSKPQLIIESSDVISVSHGNDIGSYDDDLLFYLEQRGIEEQQTKKIIMQSLIEAACIKTPYEHAFLNYFGVSYD